jgi:Right handed beta helix region
VDPNLPSLDWRGANVRLYSGDDPFSHQTATVTSSGTGRLEIALDTATTCPAICPVEKGWYYLEGVLGALDVPKEWFYDPASKTLYLRAPGGADPNTLNVTVKARNYAFDLRGKSNVTLKGLKIFGATVITDKNSSDNTLDGLHADYISHFNTLEGEGFAISNSHSAETGIIFDGSGNTLKNSEIAHSAGNGVTLLGQGNTVSNNLIHDVDYMGSYASGIVVYTSRQTITHNTIYNAGRAGILLSGSVSRDHDIGYNNTYATNLFSSDGGLIYACCNQDGSGTRVHHNWLHSSSLAMTTPPSSCCRDPQGFYIDNGSHHFEVSQNIIWDIGQGQAVFLHGDTKTSQYNLVHNNTVPDNRAALMIGDAPDATGSRIEDNRLRPGLVVILINPAANLVERNNGPTAPGATEMGAGVKVGCDFAGCESVAPPTF